jgi:hypothetical protein
MKKQYGNYLLISTPGLSENDPLVEQFKEVLQEQVDQMGVTDVTWIITPHYEVYDSERGDYKVCTAVAWKGFKDDA